MAVVVRQCDARVDWCCPVGRPCCLGFVVLAGSGCSGSTWSAGIQGVGPASVALLSRGIGV
eukprot:8602429-Pyramimonas_sp.AAC.1